MNIRKRIQQEYESFLRGVKVFDYNGLFTKFLIKEGKIIPDRIRWRNELTQLAIIETENEVVGFGKIRGKIKTEVKDGVTTAVSDFKADTLVNSRLQENKSNAVLRDFFEKQKENNVKYIYTKEETLGGAD